MIAKPTHEVGDSSNDSFRQDGLEQLTLDLEEDLLPPLASVPIMEGRLSAEMALCELATALGAHRAAIDLEVFRRSLRTDEI
jgi:hypothetical protein